MASFKLRAAVVAVTMIAATLTTTAVANAHPLDGKDPYQTGCDNDKDPGPAFPMKDRNGNTVGSIRLMWSDNCQTNWTEIQVPPSASGTIWVRTNRLPVRYDYSPGNDGHHWGDMVHAPNVCAWGNATSSNPSSTGRTDPRCG